MGSACVLTCREDVLIWQGPRAPCTLLQQGALLGAGRSNGLLYDCPSTPFGAAKLQRMLASDLDQATGQAPTARVADQSEEHIHVQDFGVQMPPLRCGWHRHPLKIQLMMIR